ncbi:hypothetical protein JWS13_27290 [Rhodococcus pseudokoreensis]|uniref:Thioesterase superfamily protein n=1 Tax=Rhodococcus pseudokoreensis TaxID=2811421 RepID=A0A974W7G5_9NOCA|nr:hypothetical protein [Rhodococcus pseudokoreensis]QSE92077.1 hypothetical protein JWS13_27290 [Rhodococcus pseudokoreensis]
MPISGASAGHGNGCFGCGTDNPIGLDLRYVAGPGLTVRTSFVPATSRLHCSGAVPFGLISAILDESMATLGCLLSKTISAEHLSIDCEQAVDAYEELTIEAKIDEIIADRFHTSAVVRVDGAAGVVATATGVYRRFAPRAWERSPETR